MENEPVKRNNGLVWVPNRLLAKNKIVDAASLVEASRYLLDYCKQPATDLVGVGPDYRKDLLSGGTSLTAGILRPFATELALKALYEWEHDHKTEKQGHKLVELYHALSPETRKNLTEQYLDASRSGFGAQQTPSIEELLEEFNDGFQESRYRSEAKYFKPGYSSPNIERLDFVVQAAWNILVKDENMMRRMFSPEQMLAAEIFHRGG